MPLGFVLLGVSPFLAIHPTFATVQVGKNDGMQVESLPPVSMPTVAMEEKLPDTALPTQLEKQGFFALAGVEWQRVALQSHGEEERKAWMSAGNAFMRAGKAQSAAASYQNALDIAGGTSVYTPETLYKLSLVTRGVSRTTVLDQLSRNPQNPWARAALWQEGLKQAALGPFTETHGLPELEDLRSLQTTFTQKTKTGAWMAAGLGIIPGAGHMLEGDLAHGGMILLFTSLFGLAFLSACRHKHYAYAFLLVVPFVSLWLNSPVMAYQLAQQNADAAWKAQLNSLKGKISTPADGATPADVGPTLLPATKVNTAALPVVKLVSQTAPLEPTPLMVPMISAKPMAQQMQAISPTPSAMK